MIEEEKVRAGPGGTPCGRPYGKGESRTRGSPSFFEPLAGGPNRSPRSPLWGDGRGAFNAKRTSPIRLPTTDSNSGQQVCTRPGGTGYPI
jgi:hypothetical protein